MTISHRYIGIDISSATLDIGDEHGTIFPQINNTPDDINRLLSTLPLAMVVVFEATGHYGRSLEKCLKAHRIAFVKVNPGRARDFARATSQLAKTDKIDACMLARMGRALALNPDEPGDDERDHLNALTVRRDQLVATRSDEARRLKTVDGDVNRDSIEAHRLWLSEEIKRFENLIKMALSSDSFKDKRKTLATAPGIALINTAVLIAQLPELG